MFVPLAFSAALAMMIASMIAALWGLLVRHEFAGAGKRARTYLAAMFLCYLLALVSIARVWRAQSL